MKTLCPCCRSPLQEGEMQRLETLSEHVSNPNGVVSMKRSYICSDPKCPTRETDICWSEDGERYGGFSFDHFIDGNDGPFGTISRRLNVEIYKKGLEKQRELFTIGKKLRGSDSFADGAIRFVMEFDYRSDENGNVLGRSWRIVKWKKDRGWIHYEWPIVRFFHCVKDGIRRGIELKRKKRKPRSGFETMHFRVIPREDRWWRIWGVKVNRFLFPSLVKEISFREK